MDTVTDLFADDPRPATARFSDCGRYRYTLTRRTGHSGDRMMLICGYNSSTAGAEKNDPTIRREIGFAKREHCAWLVKINLFAFVSAYPEVLCGLDDPVGPENDVHIRREIERAQWDGGILIAAWGPPKRANKATAALVDARAAAVLALHPCWYCFGTTQHGYPRHPLYLRADAPLIQYGAKGDA